MKLFRMVLQGMRGRKRDALTLGSVLLLAFLFLTLSSVLLSSVANTAQQQRQALYGNWQVLYYGAPDTTAAGYPGAARMWMLGATDEGKSIATIDAAVQEAGSLRLTEGRLPERSGEIAVVQGRMGAHCAVGDQLSLVFTYDYMARGGNPTGLAEQAAVLDALQEERAGTLSGRTLTWELCQTECRDWIDANRDTWLDFFGAPEDADAAQLMEDYGDTLLYYWAVMVEGPEDFGDGAYQIVRQTRFDGGLESAAGFTVNVKGRHEEVTLAGPGFGSLRGTMRISERTTSELLLLRTCTVVGILAPYADHWDVHGYTMPDAFVSPDMGREHREAVAYAEQFYYEGAPGYEGQSTLLFYDPAQDARALAGTLLEPYNAVQEPGFQLETYSESGVSEQETGFLTGLNPYTMEACTYPYAVYNGNYYLNVNGEQVFLGADPNDPAGWPALADRVLPLPAQTLTVDDLDNGNTGAFRLNTFAYPAAGGTERTLQTLLSGVLVGVAACATFQIFWVQLRRRRARLATLMAIGATDGQVLAMLLLEVLFLLLVAGAAGVGLGFALSRLLLGTVVTAGYAPDWAHLFTGLACGAAAVLLGALVPMLLALRAPLTGREPTSRRTLHLRQRSAVRPQHYWRIVLRNLSANHGRTALQFGFAWLLATICLLTVFLCHSAFDDYRREVEQTGRPDYEILAPYAMSRGFMPDVLGDLNMDASCLSYVTAENILLRCNGLEGQSGSPILGALYNGPQGDSLFTEVDGARWYTTRVVGAGEGSEMLRRILALVPEGTVTEEELLSGESCILLVPRYTPGEGGVQSKNVSVETLADLSRDEYAGYLLNLSYDPADAQLTRADTAIAPGDTLSLMGQTVRISTVSGEKQNVQRTAQTRVAAVVSVLDEPFWPWSGNNATHVILSGDSLVFRLYPSAGTRMSAVQAKNFRIMAKLFYPDCYGKTHFYLTNAPGTDGISQDTAAAAFAERYGLAFTNDRLSNERVQADAQKKMMMFLLLGVEMALVVLTILAATAASAMEQDRRRCGTLQALGVSGGQLLGGQVFQALTIGALACLAANLTLVLVAALSAVFSHLGQAALGLEVRRSLQRLLGSYPWAVHGGVCLGFVLGYLAVQIRPVVRVGRVDPIENIRS